jgi:BASS family bile acid:Na+ symporter
MSPVRRLLRVPFTAVVLAFAASGYWLPQLYTWSWHGVEPRQAILPLVQVIMFGMGVTLTLDDFVRVLKMPRAVLIGVACQYLVMPFTGLLCARGFGLQGEIAAGLILIGSCPGGVSSNVIVYLARANVPLSITLTACSTLLSPVVTPLAMRLLAGQYVPVDMGEMLFSILQMILVPLVLGFAANRFLPGAMARIGRVLPVIAMLAICIIIAITIALARDGLAEAGWALFAAAACHNAIGYALGYQASRWLGLDRRECRTVAIEVGIQNGGMATGLALNVLHSPLAALGAAVFGPWSAVTSSLLASYWRKTADVDDIR